MDHVTDVVSVPGAGKANAFWSCLSFVKLQPFPTACRRLPTDDTSNEPPTIRPPNSTCDPLNPEE
ncbi:proteasome component pre3 [Colletotrichum tofieldiae]|nr:proteasome component pre3 [Colletotrichum tofieldiae]